MTTLPPVAFLHGTGDPLTWQAVRAALDRRGIYATDQWQGRRRGILCRPGSRRRARVTLAG